MFFILIFRSEQLIVKDPWFKRNYVLLNDGHFGGISGEDVNIMAAWDSGLSGRNNIINFIAPGCNAMSTDIKPSFLRNHSYNFLLNSTEVEFASPEALRVGTQQVGHAVCNKNEIADIGPAYNSNFSVIVPNYPKRNRFSDILSQYIYEFTQDDIRVDLIPYDLDTIDRKFYYQEPIKEINDHLYDAVTRGRDYKGTIYVIPSPTIHDQKIKFSYFSNNPEVIEVSPSTNKGVVHYTSIPSSSALVNVPVGGPNFVAAKNIYPTVYGLPVWNSSSTPSITDGHDIHPSVSAGLISLILEANKNLGYRDLQWILALTSTINDPVNELWYNNSANISYSPLYGFGRVDANLSCLVAKTFPQLPRLIYCESNKSKSFLTNKVLEKPIEIDINMGADIFFEHGYLTMTISPFDLSSIHAFLESPSKTKIPILFPRVSGEENEKKILIRGFFGEKTRGTWKLIVVDSSIIRHKIENVKLEVFGIKNWLEEAKSINQNRKIGKGGALTPPKRTFLHLIAPSFAQCGQIIKIGVKYTGKEKLLFNECPILFKFSHANRAICLGVCQVNGQVSEILIPCIATVREQEAKLYAEIPLYDLYVTKPIVVFNSKQDLVEVSPDPYSKIITDQTKTIKIASTFLQNSLDTEAVVLSLFDVEKEEKIKSWYIESRWNMSVEIPQNFTCEKCLFIGNPLTMAKPDPCSSFILPIHFIKEEKTLQKFIVYLNNTCNIDPNIRTHYVPEPKQKASAWQQILEVFVKLLPIFALLLLTFTLIILTWLTKTRRNPDDLENLYLRN